MITARRCTWRTRVAGSLRPLAGVLVLGTLLVGLGPGPTPAQNLRPENSVLSPEYFVSLPLLYRGDYQRAERGLDQARRGAIRSTQSRWIDSICYFTMLGELHRRTGDLKTAHQHYDAAVRLYVQYSDWMIRVQFPDRIEPLAAAIAAPPWGNTNRRFRLGRFPERFHIIRGGQRVVAINGQAAVANVNQMQPVHVDEVVRCTCLAIRRRAELLGPTAGHDKLLQEVVQRLSAGAGPVNHWSRAWIDLQLGFALAATNRKDQASQAFARSLLVSGEFDHPLSCMAMLELGRLAVEQAQHAEALRWLQEAACSAFYFQRPEVLQEAFQLAHAVHVVQQGPGVYPPLTAAIRWSNAERLYELHAILWTAVAESHAVAGDTKAALEALGQARRAVKRHDIEQGVFGAEFHRVEALIGYLTGATHEADQALATALDFMQHGSTRLFQIDMVDAALTSGLVQERVALELYPQVLGDPTPFDWRYQPLQSLVRLISERPVSMQHWFTAATTRNDVLATLDVMDQVRARRFTSTLPWGGRLLNLRWILQAPAAGLPPAAMLQRNELVGRFPAYAALERQAEGLRDQLRQQPLFPDDNPLARQQAERMQQLAHLAAQQETVLKQIAVGRTPATTVFPPRPAAASVQQALRKGQTVLCFHVTPEKQHAFLLTYQRASRWTIHSPDAVRQQLGKWLRAMGHYDQRRPLDAGQLADDRWRAAGSQLWAEITRGAKVPLDPDVQELVIVPDGLYWYLPFEALPVGSAPDSPSWIANLRIRYAPTLGLTLPLGPAQPQLDQFAVVVGKLFPREDPRLGEEAWDGLRGQLARATALSRDHRFRGDVAATFLDGMVVLEEIEPVREGPYRLAPLQVDQGRPGASLAEWLTLPWGAPHVVVLPGFRTPAEDALKRLPPSAAGGEDLFLTIMGLQASGTRTILISRWRTGGRTANHLVREFLQELPHAAADDAWQRSVQLAQETQLDPELEPRIEPSDAVSATAAHPFLWSGYLLVDPGRYEDLPADQDAQAAGAP